MRIFAIGDIHGERERLERLLDALPRGEDAVTVFLGDALDRGPDVAGTVRRLLAEHDAAPERTVLLWGNHEDLAASHLGHPDAPRAFDYDPGVWLRNGARETMGSYGQAALRGIPTPCPAELARYFGLLRLFWRDDAGTLFVHAGIAPWEEPETAGAATLLWSRDHLRADQPPGRRVVHGHTPTPRVDVGVGRVGIDTGAVYGGPLTALQLPEGVAWQVDPDGAVESFPIAMR